MVEATLIRGFYLDDRPWARLRWILPSVVVAWAILLWALGFMLDRPQAQPVRHPIDVTLVELPAEPPPPAAHPAERPPAVQRAQPRPAVRRVKPSPRVVPPQEQPKSVEPDRRSEPTLEPAPAPQASAPPPPDSRPPISVDSGRAAARALYQPLPIIPDDLREQAIEMQALARFDIRADGTATVVLVRPTPIPALNRIVLRTLATWRFFPAMEGGKPVASSQEVRVQLEVR